MKRLQLALLFSAFSAAAVTTAACGGISDPTKGGEEGTVATVSGALTGTAVPGNARVALVFRNPKGFGEGRVQVAGDAPVVGGQFTINLGVPSDALFSPLGGDSFGSSEPPTVSGGSSGTASGGGSSSGSVPPDPVPAGGSSGSGKSPAKSPGANLSPRESVSGQITAPLSAAFAGFVVYADTNGNGKLDISGDTIASSDQLLGGNRELALVYLKEGGALDYEKLRDKSGILPVSGYNLAWDEGRWLPLNVVELKLSANPQLPTAVCHSHGYTSGVSEEEPTSRGSSGGVTSSSDGGTPSTFPSPTSPYLQCSNGGRTFTYYPPSDCPAYVPPVPGLCSGGDSYNTAAPCAGGYYQRTIGPTETVPDGWPCPVSGAIDGGSFDGGGAADGGSADGG